MAFALAAAFRLILVYTEVLGDIIPVDQVIENRKGRHN
jgi:hypothetical protein